MGIERITFNINQEENIEKVEKSIVKGHVDEVKKRSTKITKNRLKLRLSR
jgi:peroxiredoxin